MTRNRDWYIENWHRVYLGPIFALEYRRNSQNVIVYEILGKCRKWCETNLGKNGELWMHDFLIGELTQWDEIFFANKEDATAFILAHS